MIINAENLNQLNTVFRTAFNESFKNFENLARKYSTVIPIKGAAIKLFGMKPFAKMREWVGPRQRKNLEAYSFTVEPKIFEDTVEVPKTAVEDDSYGQFSNIFKELGTGPAELDNESWASVLMGDYSELGYDGKKLLANDHQMGDVVYDNYATAALSLDALKTGIDYFGNMKDDAGKKITLKPTHLVTSNTGAAHWKAQKLLNNERIYESAEWIENEAKGLLQHLVFPHISDSNFWAIVCMDQVMKPLLLMPRVEPEFTSKTKPEDDSVFNEDLFLYGARYRVNFAPGPWQLAYGSTGVA